MTDPDESDPTMLVFSDPEVREDFSLRGLLASWWGRPRVTAPPPRRPWRKRKRTWAAVAVWLAAAYPSTLPAMLYADGRGWIPGRYYPAFRVLYRPLFRGEELHPIVEPVAAAEAGKPSLDRELAAALWVVGHVVPEQFENWPEDVRALPRSGSRQPAR